MLSLGITVSLTKLDSQCVAVSESHSERLVELDVDAIFEPHAKLVPNAERNADRVWHGEHLIIGHSESCANCVVVCDTVAEQRPDSKPDLEREPESKLNCIRIGH